MAEMAIDMLPTENSSSLVIDIPTSLLRKWIESLTEDTVLGRSAWSWRETRPEIKFGNGLFSIALCGSEMPKDFEIEIQVIITQTPSFPVPGNMYMYQSACRFWTKTLKKGEVLYEECRELWNLLLFLRNGRLSANHMLVAAAAHGRITN